LTISGLGKPRSVLLTSKVDQKEINSSFLQQVDRTSTPPCLSRHTLVAAEEEHCLLLFGGFLMSSGRKRIQDSVLPNLSAELWSLDMTSRRWSLVDTYFGGEKGFFFALPSCDRTFPPTFKHCSRLAGYLSALLNPSKFGSSSWMDKLVRH
jgi:hypothetical protein